LYTLVSDAPPAPPTPPVALAPDEPAALLVAPAVTLPCGSTHTPFSQTRSPLHCESKLQALSEVFELPPQAAKVSSAQPTTRQVQHRCMVSTPRGAHNAALHHPA
jgi:hypothetical protein